MATENKSVLVLNKSWNPLRVVEPLKAFLLLTKNKAKAIDHETFALYNSDDWLKINSVQIYKIEDMSAYSKHDWITTGSLKIKVPHVIVLTSFSGFPKRKLAISRENLIRRDSFEGQPQCQYCSAIIHKTKATIDHILPRQLGGQTSWTNCVIACYSCNQKKANKTLKECGFKLLKEPIVPNSTTIINNYTRPSWKKFL